MNLSPDGWRYGVMHDDGSVTQRWNGPTQRERAQEQADRLAARYPGDHITAARTRDGRAWTREFVND